MGKNGLIFEQWVPPNSGKNDFVNEASLVPKAGKNGDRQKKAGKNENLWIRPFGGLSGGLKDLEDAGRPRPNWERGTFSVGMEESVTEIFDSEVKDTWVDNIAERNWSIAEGRRLTVAEDNNAMINARKIKNKSTISKDRVSSTFQTSEESTLVWTTACVDYDADFQLRLATESSTWTPKDKTDTSPKKKGKKDSTKPEKNRENMIRKSRTRKRKRSDDESSNSDSDLDYTLSGRFCKDFRSLGLESNYQIAKIPTGMYFSAVKEQVYYPAELVAQCIYHTK
ncbi:hypothetical protein F5050DRAFT_1709834 [Lentinula boryana]|uniref:DUF6697 domain-containing protein n=1 Tax=Lentinula boryana TaxID=40481 RepID=A0ABQ8QL97_9AGAR|nr:hypothetical protein F5050DRAFT_1709834 [Lentinula boryana]